MIDLSIAQLIYTRVEAEFSPRHQPGFQTVYRSPSLNPAEVAHIERQVQCFHPPRPETRRLQYFALPGGKLACTHSLAIASDPQIVDQLRRPGAFLAHCLIIDASAFAAIGNNAFALFASFDFLEDPQAMVIDYLRQPPDEKPLRVIRADTPSTDLASVEFRLLTMGLRAGLSRKSQQPLHIIGEAGPIQTLLRNVIARLAPAQRLLCSFDTCADRCSSRSSNYWAIGLARRQPGSTQPAVELGTPPDFNSGFAASEYIELVAAICESGEKRFFAQISPYIAMLQADDLPKLERLLRRQKDVPRSFREMLDQRSASLARRRKPR